MSIEQVRQFIVAAGDHPPTDEQAAIIDADPSHSHLVIAGAGSGKTTTMSQRVAWLVAQGLYRPSEVLGLTFTRKAAAELSKGIASKLNSAGLSQDALSAEVVEVSTYNSFAASLYRDHAALIGYEPNAIILSDASSWQLAWNLVKQANHPVLAEGFISLDAATQATITLAGQMSDNLADADAVHAYCERVLSRFMQHPDTDIDTLRSSGASKAKIDEAAKLTRVFRLAPAFVELAVEYQRLKQQRGYIEYSDQVARAFEIIDRFPHVAESYRDRFRAVLLDEYQDTSVVQTRFLAKLFAGTSVIAVGDPNQSIYGFRGASSDNLLAFGKDFGTDSVFTLSTSWRNPRSVLTVANAIAEPLRESLAKTPELHDALKPLNPAEEAVDGVVDIRVFGDADEEYAGIGRWLHQRFAETPEASAAVLVRTKAVMQPLVAALRSQGLAVHVTGMAGVLSEPAVVDLTCALRAAYDPTANSELVRLLAGARWRIAPADLEQLAKFAARLLNHHPDGRSVDEATSQAQFDSFENVEIASLVDAVEVIRANQVPRPDWLESFSHVGLDRIREAGEMLRAIRARIGMPIDEVVAHAVSITRVDVEAHANSHASTALEALDGFADLVANFTQFSKSASLGSFLDWLEQVERRESVTPRQQPPRTGVVQVLTAHAAKGLEWDYVAIPQLGDLKFPIRPTSLSGWLSYGELPYRFRGDVDVLPSLELEDLSPTASLTERIEAFRAEMKIRHHEEERRLAYVAFTRAKSEMLLTTSTYGEGVRKSPPSRYLKEAAEALSLDSATLEPPSHAAQIIRPPQEWPLDPLGERRVSVEAAATAVKSAHPQAHVDVSLRRRIDVMIAELQGSTPQFTQPTRLGASVVKDYLKDPIAAISRAKRPVPQQPYPQTRLGTLFHLWAEHRTTGRIGPELDEGLFEGADELASAHELEQLQRTFESSLWGNWKASDIEREIHVPIAGTVFVCKLDAVFRVDENAPRDDGRPEGISYQIVDWKTGKVPTSPEDLELKQTQLALYRIAYSKHLGIPIEQIDAVFYYVSDDVIIRPERLYDEAEFSSLWGEKMGSVATSSTED